MTAAAAPASAIAPAMSGSFERRRGGGGSSAAGTASLPVHRVRTRPLGATAAGAGVAGSGDDEAEDAAADNDEDAPAPAAAARAAEPPGAIAASPQATRTAFASSSMVWYRCSRSFASARAITAASSRGAPIRSRTAAGTGGGGSVRCWVRTPMKLSASNGTRPVTS